jgi:hypothetical protein
MEQFVSSGIMQQDNSEQVILDPKLIAKAGTTVHCEQSKKLFVLGLFIFKHFLRCSFDHTYHM